MELLIIRRAIRSQKRVVELVEPHSCIEIKYDTPILPSNLVPIEKPKPLPININKLFDDFKFVQKLNKLDKKSVEVESERTETGDKRSTEHLRKELPISTAPAGILDQIKPTVRTKPDYIPEGQSEPDEDET